MHGWLLADFEHVRKLNSYFADFKDVKEINNNFPDFEQMKKLTVILLTLIKFKN